jgi:hypothetical protein
MPIQPTPAPQWNNACQCWRWEEQTPPNGDGWGEGPTDWRNRRMMDRLLARKALQAPLLEEVRDELFSHILRSGVIGAPPEQQREWLGATIGYLADRYPGLAPEHLDLLREVADRFCAREPAT